MKIIVDIDIRPADGSQQVFDLYTASERSFLLGLCELEGNEYCWKDISFPGDRFSWGCTRPPGHDGPCIADDGTQVVAVGSEQDTGVAP